MKRHEQMIRVAGMAVAAAAAIMVVIALLARPVNAPKTQPPSPDSKPDTTQSSAVPAFHEPLPANAHVALTAESLFAFVADIESLVAALGFQPPARPLHDELTRSGLDPDGPATLYLILVPNDRAPVRYLLVADVADSTAFDVWLHEEVDVAPPAPPVVTDYQGVAVESGLPQGIHHAIVESRAAFGNDLELLHGFIDARTEQPAGERQHAEGVRGVLRTGPVIRRLAQWPPWSAIAGLALDPAWSDPEALPNALLTVHLQRRGATWRFRAERPAVFERTTAAAPVQTTEPLFALFAAGTAEQHAALRRSARTLAAATKDPLTFGAAEDLLDTLDGPWRFDVPRDAPELWSASLNSTDPARALQIVAELAAADAAREGTGVRCSAGPLRLCAAAGDAALHLAGSAEALSRTPSASESAEEAILARATADASALEVLVRWTARFGWNDPAAAHLLARLKAVDTEVRLLEGRVITTANVYFANDAP